MFTTLQQQTYYSDTYYNRKIDPRTGGPKRTPAASGSANESAALTLYRKDRTDERRMVGHQTIVVRFPGGRGRSAYAKLQRKSFFAESEIHIEQAL